MKKLLIGILFASGLTSVAFASDYYGDDGQNYHYVNQYEAHGRAEGHYWENQGRNEGQQAHNYHHQHYYQDDEHNHYFD